MGNCSDNDRRRFLGQMAWIAGLSQGLGGPHARVDGAASAPPPGGVIDVRAHGATGDGATDDAPALRAAATAAAGAVLWVPPGRYLIRTTIPIASGTAVLAGGAATIVQGADDINLLDLSDATEVTVRGLSFDGAGRGNAAATDTNVAVFSRDRAPATKNLRVLECSFLRLFRQAVQIQGPGGGRFSQNVTLDGNTGEGLLDEGLSVYYIRNARITGNVLLKHTNEGIKVAQCEYFHVGANQVECPYTTVPHGPLIDVGGSVNGVVAGNVVHGGVEGITLEKGVRSVTVTGNRCTGQGNEGIGASVTTGDTDPLAEIVIANNVVTDSGASNIGVVGQDHPIACRIAITGNVCRGVTRPGGGDNINITRVEDVTISGNACSDSAKHGIALGRVGRAVIALNAVDSPALDGIALTAVGAATVQGNTVWRPNRNGGSGAGISADTTSGGVLVQGNQVGDDTGKMREGLAIHAARPAVSGNQ